MELTKDIKVGSFDYQITRFTPRVGNWLVSQFLTKNLLLNIERPDQEITEKDLAGGLAATLQLFPEETFNKIQTAALDVCSRRGLANTVMPVLMKNGGGYAVDPPPTLVEVMVLTAQSLAFNLYCFFEPGALSTLHQIFPDLTSHPSTPGSADTSSDQS
jgi:hypothetical protein